METFTSVRIENATNLKGEGFGSIDTSTRHEDIEAALVTVRKAARSRKLYTITSDTTDDNGVRVVEFHRRHPMDRSRYTFHP